MKRLLDERRITFEAAYIISGKRDRDIRWLTEGMEQYPDRLLDLERLKKLPNRNTGKHGKISPVSKKQVLETLVQPPSSDDLSPVRKRDNQN